MNRLTASKRIRDGLNVSIGTGASHFDYNRSSDAKRSERRGIIYRVETYQAGGDTHRTDWVPVGWKETLLFIRARFDRFDGEECKFNHEVEDEDGEEVLVNCLVTQEHFHCKKCEAVETGVGIYHALCEKCTKESDIIRRDLTMKMAYYEHTFGIPFRADEELQEHFACESQDDGRRYREKQEDFHADG